MANDEVGSLTTNSKPVRTRENKMPVKFSKSTSTQDSAVTILNEQEKISKENECNSMRKYDRCSESNGFVGSPTKFADTSLNGGSRGLADGSDDEANQRMFLTTKKRSFNEMVDGNLQIPKSQSQSLGHYKNPKSSVCMETDKQNEIVAYRGGTEHEDFGKGNANEFVVLEKAALAEIIPHREDKSEEQMQQDEHELRKERRRQQNREAGRRSKIRRKKEVEVLQAQVKATSRETSMLAKDIMRHSEQCSKLKEENKALLEELRKVCDEETISSLEAMDSDRVLRSDDPHNSSQNQESSHESSPSPDQNTDASSTNPTVDGDFN